MVISERLSGVVSGKGWRGTEIANPLPER